MRSADPGQTRHSSNAGSVAAPPLTRAEDGAEGALILRELPGEAGLLVWGALRDVMLWTEAAAETRGLLFPPDGAATREGLVEAARMDRDLQELLLSLTSVASAAGTIRAPSLADICLALARWAETHSAPETRLAFTQAAALLRPGDAELALETGRLARDLGHSARAESWLRRAVRLARNKDWETYVWAFMALALMYWRAGNPAAAHALAHRALRKAHRHRLRVLKGTVLHNLLLFLADHDIRRAYEHAHAALRAYGAAHPRVPILAQDVACFWVNQGQYARALPVIEAALPRVEDPHERGLVSAALARAAAGAGERDLYERARIDTLRTLAGAPSEARKAEALIILARADVLAGEWTRAEAVALEAVTTATGRGERFVREAAAADLEAIRAHQDVGLTEPAPESRDLARQAMGLQAELLRSLQAPAAGDK